MNRRSIWRFRLQLKCCFFTLATLAAMSAPRIRAQDLELTARSETNNSVGLTLTGAADKYYRIDYSTNLTFWSPLDLFLNTNETTQLTDPLNFTDVLHVYRAVQVEPVTGILNIFPASGAAGTSIVIEGQFFSGGQPGDNVITFGGVEGTVTEVTSTRLVATVPPGARTGAISINTPNGIIFSEQIFTVTCSNAVSFSPPNGFNADDFIIASDYGPSVTNSPGHYEVTIADGLASLIVASPRDTNSHTFFYAVAGSCDSEVALNAFSTAQAMVFQCPLFLTDDAAVAEHLRAIIASDANVAAFGQVIAQVYATNSADPFSTSNFISAYAAAIESVATNGSVLAEALKLQGHPGGSKVSSAAAVFPLEWYQTRFLELAGSDSKYKVKGFPFNPVDWLVLFQEVDVEKAFPNGHFDFDKIAQNNFPPLELYPIKPGFEQERHISADLAASRLNFVSYLSKELVKAMSSTSSAIDQSVNLSNDNAIYVVRGIGPSFLPPEDYDFVQQNFSDVYIRAVAINIVSAAIDLASAAFESGKLDQTLGDSKFKVKLIDEAIKIVPTIQSKEDFLVGAGKLEAFLIKEAAGDLIKKAAGALAEESAAALKGVLANKKLKVAAGVGQIVERASGIVRTTTLETSLIMAGNPFQLQVLSITPNGAKPGTDLAIVFRGSPVGRQFDPKNVADQINFEGTTIFDGEVRSVSGPDANGVQTLTVRVPSDLPATADGTYTVFVNCQGRRGSGLFSLSSRPIITSVFPTSGFAPGTLAGVPFSGTFAQVHGVNFVSSDTFLFSGGASGIEATTKFGSSGNIALQIPDGAQSGPIRIQKIYDGQLYETSSPPFTVLGPPTLISMSPSNGTIGVTVHFQANNLGNDATALRVQFTGSTPQQPGLLGNVASIAVPSGATSGPVTLFTPAGQTAGSFMVTTGLASGSEIDVGGSSVITMSRAAEIAGGVGAPLDDDADFIKDANGIIISVLDPPFEEGDYVYPDRHGDASPRFVVGAVYSDFVSVSGTVGGDAMFVSSNETVSGGTLTGTITLNGDNFKFGTITVSGQVIINGNNNTIYYSTFRNCPGDALVIHGNNNQVLGCDFYTNGGDGIRIDGGKYNYIEINHSRGNGGNGITLTGNAEYNEVLLTTGSKGVLDSGNMGHGIALIGQAHFNNITGLSPGIFGNQKDGVYLDGAGVFSNRFKAIISSDNRGNGVTVTNGGRGNMFGTVSFDGVSVVNLTAERNGGNGAAFYGARDFQVALRCNSNQFCGLLMSGVVESNHFTSALLSTATGNGRAGARFEQGTRGVELRTSSSAKTNGAGLELEGTNTAQNSFTMDISGSTGNGVNLIGARSNAFVLTVNGSAGNGVFVSGGGNNAFRIRSVIRNQGDGLVFTDGATNNRVFPDSFAASFISNRNGIVINNGASGNVIDRFSGTYSRSNGIVVHGGFTSGNRFLRPIVKTSGGDGIRFEFGANGNTVGSLPANTVFGSTDGSISDNDGAGIRMTDPGTDNNFIYRTFISSSVRTQAVGVVIENGAAHNTLQFDSIARNGDGVVIQNQASDVALKSLYIDSNTKRGLVISNATDVFVGASGTNDFNQITKNQIGVNIIGANATGNWLANSFIQQNTNAGIILEAGAHQNRIGPANDVRGNAVGVVISGAHSNDMFGNVISQQTGDGVQISDGSVGNQITGNAIDHNGRGVFVSGGASLGNSALFNSITANLLIGIQLAAGGNTEIAAPSQMNFFNGTLSGVANAPDGSRVEIFKDVGEQGAELLAIGELAGNSFQIPLQVDASDVGFFFNLNATVTDPAGNTSEFGTSTSGGLLPTKIVFTSTRDGNQELYARDSISGSASSGLRLTVNPAADHSPVLSCDSLTVLFVSDRSGNDDIFTMSPQPNSPATQLTVNPARDYDARWDSNCAKIIFISERDGAPAIYLMDADGANQTRLSPMGVTDLSPDISSDGGKVVFASNRGGSFHIYVMNSDGSGAQIRGAGAGADTQPTWSPDGQFIAFISDRDGNPEVYTMRADGTQLTRITSDIADDASPSWTPDGGNLIFSSNRSGAGSELYVVNRNGGTARRLSISSGNNAEPSAR